MTNELLSEKLIVEHVVVFSLVLVFVLVGPRAL